MAARSYQGRRGLQTRTPPSISQMHTMPYYAFDLETVPLAILSICHGAGSIGQP